VFLERHAKYSFEGLLNEKPASQSTKLSSNGADEKQLRGFLSCPFREMPTTKALLTSEKIQWSLIETFRDLQNSKVSHWKFDFLALFDKINNGKALKSQKGWHNLIVIGIQHKL